MGLIAVFGASIVEPETSLYRQGHLLGADLARMGHAVATGGYGGLMEAVSAGAADVGGTVVGFTAPPVFPRRVGANAHVDDERPADTLATRIAMIHDQADACIALHGSIGTLTELLVAWNSAFVAPFSDSPPKPVIAIGSRWESTVSFLADTIEADASMVHVVDNTDQAVRLIGELL